MTTTNKTSHAVSNYTIYEKGLMIGTMELTPAGVRQMEADGTYRLSGPHSGSTVMANES